MYREYVPADMIGWFLGYLMTLLQLHKLFNVGWNGR
jgi:hypothetical protein